MTIKPLNQGQQEAADAFFAFLLSDEKEFIISGGGGVGKTYLMGALIDDVMPRYFELCGVLGKPVLYDQVVMTATTNKAAEVLSLATGRPTSTIHSFLALKVTEDYETGATKLAKTNGWKVHERTILFIDECSLVDSPLRTMILEGTHKCKIVYVGDHCQLAPITEPLSPIYRDNITMCELTEPMRNAGQPALLELCNQLRHTVETGEFFPIPVIPGVIDWLDDSQMETQIGQTFAKQTQDSKIVAYTNNRVNQFNDHIREIRQLPASYIQGEFLVSNSAVRVGKSMISVEDEITIVSQTKHNEMVHIGPDAELEICRTTLSNRRGEQYVNVPVPVDRDHYLALIKYYQKQKNWNRYFHLKTVYPDLRPRDASTVHKSQGSTYDSVFIDLGNISTCHNADQVARMLYVAVSRAKSRVFLYGQLAEKYGGLAF